MSVTCEICNIRVSNKYNLAKHKLTESCQKIKREIEYNNNIIILNNKIKELESEIEQLKINNIEKDKIIFNLKEQSQILKDKSEEYRKIVEKAATKSTKTINNNNKNTYNYLNYISQEPIKFSEIQQKINKLVTTKTIMFDNYDFNEHITKNMLKDENGKDKVLCTDINRKNFTYKDEKSGQLISDPELERLREQLIKSSNNKSIKKDLLDKLIQKYEGSGIDPYTKFYEYLQNIQFGTPFIEHVAKKTYIKTKSLNELKNSNESVKLKKNELYKINYDIDLDKINDEDIEKLYNQLKEEFKDEFD